MQATLLTPRLRKLETSGVVKRRQVKGGWAYHLAQAGEELRPVVVGLGYRGARWIGSRLKPRQLDAGFLMWDIRRFARLDMFPADERVVIHVQFTDAPRGERLWRLVKEDRTADLCRDDPGHEVSVEVESTVRALTEVWTGDSDPDKEVHAGRLNVLGGGRRGQALWKWLGRSMFAPTRMAVRP